VPSIHSFPSMNFVTVFTACPLPPRLTSCSLQTKTENYSIFVDIISENQLSFPRYHLFDQWSFFSMQYTQLSLPLDQCNRGLSFSNQESVAEWEDNDTYSYAKGNVLYWTVGQFSNNLGGDAFGLYPRETEDPEILSLLLWQCLFSHLFLISPQLQTEILLQHKYWSLLWFNRCNLLRQKYRVYLSI
jgi:hypothetical protein